MFEKTQFQADCVVLRMPTTTGQVFEHTAKAEDFSLVAAFEGVYVQSPFHLALLAHTHTFPPRLLTKPLQTNT